MAPIIPEFRSSEVLLAELRTLQPATYNMVQVSAHHETGGALGWGWAGFFGGRGAVQVATQVAMYRSYGKRVNTLGRACQDDGPVVSDDHLVVPILLGTAGLSSEFHGQRGGSVTNDASYAGGSASTTAQRERVL